MTQYQDKFAHMAMVHCQQCGATDGDLAVLFDVELTTIKQWQALYSTFRRACRVGGEQSIERAKRMLYHRAVGYDHDAVKIINNKGVPIYADYIEHHPPDVAALKFFLTNKCPEEYSDKSSTEITGKDGAPLNPVAPDMTKFSDETLAMMERDLEK